jgi:hypothetical protein
MDPEEQPVNDELEDESESSDAESDEAGRDTDISDSWGALPATTQQVKAQSAPQICVSYTPRFTHRHSSCLIKFKVAVGESVCG